MCWSPVEAYIHQFHATPFTLACAPVTLCPPQEEDWAALLKAEEETIKRTCDQIIAFKPDVVITEKGLSDLAAHFFTKAGISAIRRLRKTDNNRIARASGATIVSRCVLGPGEGEAGEGAVARALWEGGEFPACARGRAHVRWVCAWGRA